MASHIVNCGSQTMSISDLYHLWTLPSSGYEDTASDQLLAGKFEFNHQLHHAQRYISERLLLRGIPSWSPSSPSGALAERRFELPWTAHYVSLITAACKLIMCSLLIPYLVLCGLNRISLCLLGIAKVLWGLENDWVLPIALLTHYRLNDIQSIKGNVDNYGIYHKEWPSTLFSFLHVRSEALSLTLFCFSFGDLVGQSLFVDPRSRPIRSRLVSIFSSSAFFQTLPSFPLLCDP